MNYLMSVVFMQFKILPTILDGLSSFLFLVRSYRAVQLHTKFHAWLYINKLKIYCSENNWNRC